MTSLPDIVIVGYQQEKNSTVSLTDTNCNFDLTDILIPVNDVAIVSIRLILNKLVFAICESRSNYTRNS
ncbi:hypothetical protein HN51_007282 [Arachis hypogaea]